MTQNIIFSDRVHNTINYFKKGAVEFGKLVGSAKDYFVIQLKNFQSNVQLSASLKFKTYAVVIIATALFRQKLMGNKTQGNSLYNALCHGGAGVLSGFVVNSLVGRIIKAPLTTKNLIILSLGQGLLAFILNFDGVQPKKPLSQIKPEDVKKIEEKDKIEAEPAGKKKEKEEEEGNGFFDLQSNLFSLDNALKSQEESEEGGDSNEEINTKNSYPLEEPLSNGLDENSLPNSNPQKRRKTSLTDSIRKLDDSISESEETVIKKPLFFESTEIEKEKGKDHASNPGNDSQGSNIEIKEKTESNEAEEKPVEKSLDTKGKQEVEESGTEEKQDLEPSNFSETPEFETPTKGDVSHFESPSESESRTPVRPFEDSTPKTQETPQTPSSSYSSPASNIGEHEGGSTNSPFSSPFRSSNNREKEELELEEVVGSTSNLSTPEKKEEKNEIITIFTSPMDPSEIKYLNKEKPQATNIAQKKTRAKKVSQKTVVVIKKKNK